MTTSITAVFEGGLLRPTLPLDLTDGTRVELIIISNKTNDTDGRDAANLLAEIAALPTAGGDARTGLEHDQVLYGEKGAR